MEKKTLTSEQGLAKYKENVKRRLEELRPIFAAAAVGDFSRDIKIPESDDEFTETIVGAQIMLEVIRTQLSDLQKLNSELEKHVGQLKQAMDKQIQADKEKNKFIAILAHELRNPLAPIVSTLEWLENQAQRPESEKMIKNAEYQASMMKRLLDDLLDVASIAQDTFKVHKENIDLIPVLEHAIHGVSAFMKFRSHSMLTELPGESIPISGDDFRLTQAFSNILFNAAKYTEPGGLIEVSCQTTDTKATVKVKDNGIGISKEMMPRVFDAFVQTDPMPKVGSGLGIGLSMAKRLFEMHGGTIEAMSDGKGKGSVFTITLPILKKRSEEEPHLPITRRKKTFKILLVDDNEAAAQSLGMILQYRGHSVELAYDGVNAIKKATEIKPEVILLDIGLPDMNGYEVIGKIRTKPSNTVFIALTGFGQDEDKRKAANAGFDFHLTKPIGYNDLEKILTEINAA
jgi:signal transduction histidine kinase